MNTTYFDLQSQIQTLNRKMAALTKQAEQVRMEERNPAIAEIQKLISTYSIKSSELFPKKSKDQINKSKKSPAKFRDPVTGKEWSGRGQRPNWINGKDHSQFLIPESVASPTVDPVAIPLTHLAASQKPTPLANPVIEPVMNLAPNFLPIIKPVSCLAINPAASPMLSLVANPSVDHVDSQVVEPINRLVAEPA